MKDFVSANMEHTKNILITGLPGVGKTSLITKLCDALKGLSLAGFYTTEIREEGVRKGFRLISLDGRKSVLAHVDFRSHFRVGKYRVDVKGFEEFLNSIDLDGSSASIILIDEIGKMECLSAKFMQMMSRLLDSPKTIIATIAIKGEGLISWTKHRPDGRLFEITKDNRDSLVFDVMGLLERILAKRKE